VQCAQAEWKEASRDFTRTFVSGASDMLLIGARSPEQADGLVPESKLLPIACTIDAGGNVNEEVNAAAVTEFKGVVAQALAVAAVAADLSELTERLIGHLTVTPAMQLLIDHEVSPAMFQNKFVVMCSANADVVVATYGFIGGPVRGDRPDRKSTPFVLRLLTANLCEQAEGYSSDAAVDKVQYAVQRTSATLIDEVIADDRERMVAAVGGAGFSHFFDLAAGSDVAASGEVIMSENMEVPISRPGGASSAAMSDG
jgi:hypothetical protein